MGIPFQMISNWWVGYHFKAWQGEVAKRSVIKDWVFRSQRCDCCKIYVVMVKIYLIAAIHIWWSSLLYGVGTTAMWRSQCCDCSKIYITVKKYTMMVKIYFNMMKIYMMVKIYLIAAKYEWVYLMMVKIYMMMIIIIWCWYMMIGWQC